LEQRLFLLVLLMSIAMPVFWLVYRLFFFPDTDLVILHAFTLVTGLTLYFWFRKTGDFELVAVVFFFYWLLLYAIAYFPAGGIKGTSIVFGLLVYCFGLLVLPPRFFILFSVLMVVLNVILPTIEFIFPEMVASDIKLESKEILGRTVSNFVSYTLLGVCLYYFKKEYVTEDYQKRMMTDRLSKEKEKLESSERYKSMFLNTVWQEMHAPLSGIDHTVEGLKKTSLTVSQNRLLDRLQRNSQLLQSILDDVIDVSQIGVNKVPVRQVEFNLSNEVQEILEILQNDNKNEDTAFHYHQRNGIPDVLIGDPVRIKQAISSLINSAIRFMQGSEVTVESSLLIRSGNTCTIRFLITCKGTGLSMRRRAEILKKFYSSDEFIKEADDFGLDMLMPKSLVESMGGLITFSVDDSYNFNFFFDIPFDEGDAKYSTL
ncbi:MAG: HAMP domain-containing sensor histidine kinase, partial [Bacteroidota bacterium]